jgi:DNA-binding transcriptional ArsR family regulator
MSSFTHPDTHDFDLPQVLYALGDPTRLAIVKKLSECEGMSCGDVCCDTPRSTLTHHLKILRESGLITTEKHGQTHFNSLRKTDLETRFPGLLKSVLQQAS